MSCKGTPEHSAVFHPSSLRQAWTLARARSTSGVSLPQRPHFLVDGADHARLALVEHLHGHAVIAVGRAWIVSPCFGNALREPGDDLVEVGVVVVAAAGNLCDCPAQRASWRAKQLLGLP